jgi:hypothetical protein
MTLLILCLIYHYYKYSTKTENAVLITLALTIDFIILNG